MGNAADEATLIRQWLTNELAALLNGAGPSPGEAAQTVALNAILAELRLANQRWFGTDAIGTTYPTPLSPFFTGVSDIITGNAPPVAGYELWLDVKRDNVLWQDTARTTPAAASDPVASWHDPTSGRSATASGAARPVRAANGLTFDGSDDALALSTLPVHEFAGLTVVAAVVTGASVPGNQAAVGMQQAGVARWAMGPCADSTYRHGWGGAAANVPFSSPAVAHAANTGYVHVWRKGPTGWEVRRNDLDGSAVADSSYPTAAPVVWVGAEPESGGAYWFNGEIRAVLVYPFELGATGLALTAEWMAARHLITF